MTNDKLFDNLADDVIEGAAKNRKGAMMLLEECKIRERKPKDMGVEKERIISEG